MHKKMCSDAEFQALFLKHGATETARILGVLERSVYRRRTQLEASKGQILPAPSTIEYERDYLSRIPIKITDGIIMVGSDWHFWPGRISTTFRAFCFLARELQPKGISLNGDGFDGARISRHPPLGWAEKPSVKHELEAVDERTEAMHDSCKSAELYWSIGNHDARFENRLANQAPEYEGVPGFKLKDHFPRFKFGISFWVNDHTVIKHRYKGGVHATHNNTLNAGKSIVTGHLHSLKVTPFDDYNGTRFGVDTGVGDDPYGPQFDYAEDNPLNHRSGFAVLSFYRGKLLWPELAQTIGDGEFQFRGKVYKV